MGGGRGGWARGRARVRSGRAVEDGGRAPVAEAADDRDLLGARVGLG